jgi:hypothetical protein
VTTSVYTEISTTCSDATELTDPLKDVSEIAGGTTATLTDASGVVKGETYGDLFHLRYPMKTPVGGHMEQWLYLQPDGHTVMNEATVRLFGVVVAHLSERITHEDR